MKKLIFLLSMIAALGTTSCTKDDNDINNPPDSPRTEVPAEIVGAWEHGYIDFVFGKTTRNVIGQAGMQYPQERR